MAHIDRFQQDSTHRLVPRKYADGVDLLKGLSLSEEILGDLREMSNATNDQAIAERGKSLNISERELLAGVPEASMVNSAFCHPGQYGARFSSPQRGAWYAGVSIETSVAEVAYHKHRDLKYTRAIGEFAFQYRDFLADFDSDFHYLDPEEEVACLQPEPIPECYAKGQALAQTLLHAGGQGIVYASVRNRGGTCIACFRPAIIAHPRRGALYAITVNAIAAGSVFQELSADSAPV